MTALKPLGSAQREISLRHSLFEEAIALVRNSAVGVLVTAIQVIAGSAWRWCTSERKRRCNIFPVIQRIDEFGFVLDDTKGFQINFRIGRKQFEKYRSVNRAQGSVPLINFGKVIRQRWLN